MELCISNWISNQTIDILTRVCLHHSFPESQLQCTSLDLQEIQWCAFKVALQYQDTLIKLIQELRRKTVAKLNTAACIFTYK